MKLRVKLALGYTAGFTLVLGLTFWAIYLISDKYRKEEFYERLKQRTLTTSDLMARAIQIDQALVKAFDRNTINSVDEEKILLFDSTGRPIYTSLDDTKILYSQAVLKELMAGRSEIEMNEGDYEMVGVRFKDEGHTYYGIAKAYDFFGRSKLDFLKWLLIATFAGAAAITAAVSFYISNLITRPLARLAGELGTISPEDLSVRVHTPNAEDEVGFLAGRFNQLLGRVENAFRFQNHFVHHLSHELKTPLAVMMANAERALTDGSQVSMADSLRFQKEALMELSYIINAMLDISRSETQPEGAQLDAIRLDELLFECVSEIQYINDAARFELAFDEAIDSSESLTLPGNGRMLKLALMNLLKNAVTYSTDRKAYIRLMAGPGTLVVRICNDGPTLTDSEQAEMFRHLFRGRNSAGHKGFGLGLVLVQRVAALHRGTIAYNVSDEGLNCFHLRFPADSTAHPAAS